MDLDGLSDQASIEPAKQTTRGKWARSSTGLCAGWKMEANRYHHMMWYKNEALVVCYLHQTNNVSPRALLRSVYHVRRLVIWMDVLLCIWESVHTLTLHSLQTDANTVYACTPSYRKKHFAVQQGKASWVCSITELVNTWNLCLSLFFSPSLCEMFQTDHSLPLRPCN